MHGIKIASLQSGLSAHVIRMWEKRYNAVEPLRTDTNRRLYDEACIDRLSTLSKLTQGGHSIGQIAHLDDAELQTLCNNLPDRIPKNLETPSQHRLLIDKLLIAIEKFDKQAHDTLLDEATKANGYSHVLEKVLIPFIQEVGSLWQEGSFTTVQEHAATSFIKDYLCVSAQAFGHEPNAPKLLVSTPPGQLHELGAVIASSLARKLGWHVIYLGVSTPPEELAGAAETIGAKAVLLSIIYPLDDPMMENNILKVRQNMDSSIKLIIGGPHSEHYEPLFKSMDLTSLHSMEDFKNQLQALR
ncbi:MerR family transcriptional regulator [Rubritalea marina]|uniref:MerR family transcriptional regulator n=1 Tax=Rubritalea marina TaxID=361055 RepID=UPI00035F845F|nr:cobalamin B12-binding domain-containing protein [Rubritalea marina]